MNGLTIRALAIITLIGAGICGSVVFLAAAQFLTDLEATWTGDPFVWHLWRACWWGTLLAALGYVLMRRRQRKS